MDELTATLRLPKMTSLGEDGALLLPLLIVLLMLLLSDREEEVELWCW